MTRRSYAACLSEILEAWSLNTSESRLQTQSGWQTRTESLSLPAVSSLFYNAP